MSERDPSPAGPTPQWPDQPPAGWGGDTTPGLPPAGSGPFSGAGASAVGGGAVGTNEEGTAYGSDERHDQRQGHLHGYPAQEEHRETSPQYSTSPVTVRRPDVLAGLLLLLAGLAAAISLLLEWLADGPETGWDLVDGGIDAIGRDFEGAVDSGSWQPVAIILGGGALLVLGLLMFVPARSHRTLGVLALLVALLATAGVVVTANDLDWDRGGFGIGLWFGVAVAALGLLGAFKAMLTSPKLR